MKGALRPANNGEKTMKSCLQCTEDDEIMSITYELRGLLTFDEFQRCMKLCR
jgi:hypothetical protein